MLRNLVVVLCLLGFGGQAQASLITISQTFSEVAYNDYGVETGIGFGTTPTGDWIFSAVVDSNTANISPWPDVGAFQLTSLTLTQASLGLFGAEIVNAPVLIFYPNLFGFAFDFGGQAPWTRIIYEPDHFASAHTLSEYLALVTIPTEHSLDTGFGPQWTGFTFADGRSLYGMGFGVGIPSVITAVVPEPSGLVLMLLAAAWFAWNRRPGGRSGIVRRI